MKNSHYRWTNKHTSLQILKYLKYLFINSKISILFSYLPLKEQFYNMAFISNYHLHLSRVIVAHITRNSYHRFLDKVFQPMKAACSITTVFSVYGIFQIL